MADIQKISCLKDFIPFEGENKIIEILIRDKNKRIKKFQKVVLNDFEQTKGKELIKEAIQKLDKSIGIQNKNLQLTRKLIQNQNLSFLLNSINLCATCVGFMIINEKLNQMNTEILKQFEHLGESLKREYDVNIKSEILKVKSDYNDMLDCRKKGKPYDESKMRNLVDMEYNTMTKIIDMMQNDLISDKRNLMEMLINLLSMFTISIKYFDRLYYFNNHESLKAEDRWHISHEQWMHIYDQLTSKWFVEMLQDYAVFETDLSLYYADLYYIEILDSILEQKQGIRDNQELISYIDDEKTLNILLDEHDKEVKNTIKESFDEVFEGVNDNEINQLYDNVLSQIEFA